MTSKNALLFAANDRCVFDDISLAAQSAPVSSSFSSSLTPSSSSPAVIASSTATDSVVLNPDVHVTSTVWPTGPSTSSSSSSVLVTAASTEGTPVYGDIASVSRNPSTIPPCIAPSVSGVSLRRAGQKFRYAPPPGLTTTATSIPAAEQPAQPTSCGIQVAPSIPTSDVISPSTGSTHTEVHITPADVHWFHVSTSIMTSRRAPVSTTVTSSTTSVSSSVGGENGEDGEDGGGNGGNGGNDVVTWTAFSQTDSDSLEQAYCQLSDATQGDGSVVCVMGGRYEADVGARLMRPLYWQSETLSLRRCSWFSRGPHENNYVPYSERHAAKLEEAYVRSMLSGSWHCSVQLNDRLGYVVLHSAHVFVQHVGIITSWENVNMPDDPSRPRQVRRGWRSVEGASVPADEAATVNHLVLMVHGIGSWCDLKFRSVNECVDDLRRMSCDLLSCHFSGARCDGRLGRVELLPVSWHDALHGDATGIDTSLQAITLRSIPLLRDFTNDTICDVLYYTSPVYCQVIVDAVTSRINSIYEQFCRRQPGFKGGVSLVGHSLGALILFDLLSHQRPAATNDDGGDGCDEGDSSPPPRQGSAGTGQPSVRYPRVAFQPTCFFGLGSPVALFTRVRGLSGLRQDFSLPTCRHVFNIFHPFDPVAYRLEPLIDPAMAARRPVLIPHHKGRKRMHLEIKEQMVRMGSDLKNRLMTSLQSTMHTMSNLKWIGGGAVVEDTTPPPSAPLQGGSHYHTSSSDDQEELNIKVGSLNGGRRIDYVLQEKPFESLNEYVFAFQSHLCYWESEDTLLMMLKEILRHSDILCDSDVCGASSDNCANVCHSGGALVTSPPLTSQPHISDVLHCSSTQTTSSTPSILNSATVLTKTSATDGGSIAERNSTFVPPPPPLNVGGSANGVGIFDVGKVPCGSKEADLPRDQVVTHATFAPSVPLVPVPSISAPLATPTLPPPPPPPIGNISSAVASGHSLTRRPCQILPQDGVCGVDPTAAVPGAKVPPPPPPTQGFRRN